MNFFSLKLQRGFTLIELLVVIAVIGVLATVTLSVINPFGQFAKARDAQRKSDLNQIRTALELWSQDNNGMYPADDSFLNGGSWGNYMPKVPKDPSDPANKYAYIHVSDPSMGEGYRLYASLERASDPQSCPSPGCTGAPASPACGAGNVCNYDVTSSNLAR